MAKAFLENLEGQPDYVVASFMKNEYESFVESTQSDRVRQERNFKLYSGVDLGQWDSEAVKTLMTEGRPLNQFNYCQKTVDEILGALEDNPLYVYYDPTHPTMVDEFNLIQELYDFDYEQGNWEGVFHDIKRDGLIFKGVLKYFYNYEHSRLGNPGMKAINPTSVIFDPRHQERSLNKCRIAFEFSWMTARQIVEDFDVSSDELKNYLENEETLGSGLDASNDVDKLDDRASSLYYDTSESRFKVIQAVYMQTLNVKMLFDTNKNKFMKVKEPKLIEQLMNLPGSQFAMKSKELNVCKIFTFAPGISPDLVLAKGNHPVQIGRIPYERWSSKNIYGQEQGIVDVIADPQITVNKREAILDYFALTAANGNKFIDPNAFADDSEKERYHREKNIPGARDFEVDGDALEANAIARDIPRGEYPADLDKRIDNAKEFINWVGVNDALKGKSAGSRESGDSLSFKAEAGLSSFETYNIGLKEFLKNVGTAYYYMAMQNYKQIPRILKNSKKNKAIFLNQKMQDGSILNPVEDMGKFNVMVRLSTSGKKNKREMLAKYDREIQNSTDPIMQAIYAREKIKYMDLPEDIQAEAIDAANRTIQHLKTQMEAQDAQLIAQIKQVGGTPAAGQEGQSDIVRESANMPGMGGMPQAIGGGQTSANNSSPSDFINQ